MGIIDNIKRDAGDKGVAITPGNAGQLEHIFNQMFYCDCDRTALRPEPSPIYELNWFTKAFHRRCFDADTILSSGKNFCLREAVLSMLYEKCECTTANAGEQRIAIGDESAVRKWQHLFVTSGYMMGNNIGHMVNRTRYGMPIWFAPDFVCKIPEYTWGDVNDNDGAMIGILKLASDSVYKVMGINPYAEQRLQWYMHLSDKYKRGFIIIENRNNRQFKVEVHDYDPDKVSELSKRAEAVHAAHRRLLTAGKMPAKLDWSTPTHSDCRGCEMYNACYDVGEGRVRYERD